MNVETFHLKLLSISPKDEKYTLTQKQKEFYAAFEDLDVRGFNSEAPTEEQVIATLVLALHQTSTPGQDKPTKVILAVSRHLYKESLEQIKTLAKYTFQIRKGYPASSLKPLFSAFEAIVVGSNILQITHPPDKWVALGYCTEHTLPPWSKGKLL